MLACHERPDAHDVDRSRAVRETARAAEAVLAPWVESLAPMGIDPAAVLAAAVEPAVDDLLALARRDPAGMGSWEYVLGSYACFRAVLAHRVAHAVLAAPAGDRWPALTAARAISEEAKVRTGVEIHPAAEIGPRFVVDHGVGTVIGEDTVIGADCYILQGVVVGARGIADNASGRRHPRLGDRVQVGGFARVLGPISVGDDVVIGCHALVRSDVPAGARVAVLHQYQMVTGPLPVTIYGVEALGESRFRLHGADLDQSGIEVDLLDPTQAALAAGDLTVLQRSAETLVVQVSARVPRPATHIRIRHGGSEVTVGIPVCGARPVPPTR